MSSSLCSVALLTVTPPTSTGSSIANGIRLPGAADVDLDVEQLRDRGRGRELEGDRPARLAADDAELALQVEVVDLDDDAVDLEVEPLAALLPGEAARLTTASRSRATRRRGSP